MLHDPVWYDHLPYVPFPTNWPVFTPKDKLAEWFESYAKLLELNCWTQTNLQSANWDKKNRLWTVQLERKKSDGTIEYRELHPRHIIQATGHSGEMSMPSIKGMHGFQGDRLCHSSREPLSACPMANNVANPRESTDFRGAQEHANGKKAIVVGCCNSGHDIAQVSTVCQ